MKIKLILSSFFSFIIYFLLVVYFGIDNIILAISEISLLTITLAVFFVLLSLFFEFLRWEFYLKRLNVNLSILKSSKIFLSGLSLGFMPAKSGELIRQVLLKKEKIPFKKSIPIHFISNLTGFIVVLGFSSSILLIYGNIKLFYLALILILGFFFSLRFPVVYLKLISLIKNKTNFKFISGLEKTILYSKKLVGIKELLVSLILTVIYWGCIGIAFLIIASNFKINIPIFVAFSVYSISLILGVLSMLPGGVGMVEGSSIIILSNYMDASSAAVLVIIMRIITLWLTMLIGVISLNSLFFSKNHDKK